MKTDIKHWTTQLMKLFVQVTEPNNMQAIERLVSRLPKLKEGSALLDELPNLIATSMDVFDEYANQLKAEGIDLEQSVRQGLHAALYLGGQINEEELDRIMLQHTRFATVYALGDASSLPTSKTGTAIRKQAPVLPLLARHVAWPRQKPRTILHSKAI